MLFNSTEFIVFFLMVTAWAWAIHQRFRWPMLLLASCYFYMVFVPKYILILFTLIIIDYAAGLLIARSRGLTRKIILVCSLVSNVGMLAFFKYFNFADHEVTRIASWLGIPYHGSPLNIILPIGLSFHTFQSMSYTIEVYRGKQAAEKHFGIYALYVMFYPQMVAGPIERPQNLLRQFHGRPTFQAVPLIEGIQLIVWGLLKKMVVADNLALIVDPAFEDPQVHGGGALWLATYSFAFQIYYDFSGYSDIARGAARSMGYELMRNFNVPYSAQSIAEFWRRWHISLSTWFKDYLFIPLGGSRCGMLRNYFNILVVFLVSGLWHGASWAFIIWGGIHGSFMILGDLSRKLREKLWQACGFGTDSSFRKAIALLVTFHLVLIAWIFFRAGQLHRALEVLGAMVTSSTPHDLFPPNLDRFHQVGLAVTLALLVFADFVQRRFGLKDAYYRLPGLFRLGLFVGGIFLILLWGRFESHDFIYFQF
jgi:alginate O-acetyltransferase complex protein AlgI